MIKIIGVGRKIKSDRKNRCHNNWTTQDYDGNSNDDQNNDNSRNDDNDGNDVK